MTMADYQKALTSLGGIAPMLETMLRKIGNVRLVEPDDPVLLAAGNGKTVGAAINAKALYINEPWFDTLVLEDRRFVLGHEAWHPFQRLDTRIKYIPPCSQRTWKAAIDMAANECNVQCGIERKLLKEGWYPEEHGFPRFRSIETYVKCMQDKYGEDEDQWPQWLKDKFGDGQMDGHELTKSMTAAGEIEPDDEGEGSVLTEDSLSEAALECSDDTDISRRVFIETMGGNRRDWRNILRDMLSQRTRGGRNFCRPSRFEYDPTIILPSNIRTVLPRIAFVIDFSGSMQENIASMADDLIDIIKEFTGGRYLLITCSSYVHNVFENNEEGMPRTARQILDLYGGVNTDMQPAFDLAKSKGYNKIICLTDALVPDENFKEEGVFWVWKTELKDLVLANMAKVNPNTRHVNVA